MFWKVALEKKYSVTIIIYSMSMYSWSSIGYTLKRTIRIIILIITTICKTKVKLSNIFLFRIKLSVFFLFVSLNLKVAFVFLFSSSSQTFSSSSSFLIFIVIEKKMNKALVCGYDWAWRARLGRGLFIWNTWKRQKCWFYL